MKDKNVIRNNMILLRKSLNIAERIKLDNIIFEKIINSFDYKNASCIFIFVSYKSEIDTHNIIKEALADGKIVCVPKVISKDKGMIAGYIKKFSDLVHGKFNILEPPDDKSEVCRSRIDLAYIPGVAFDNCGGRLGYGGGYYDRFLKGLRTDCKKIGICYKFQIVDKVPMEEHDIYIDKIISN
ncbi:5-formyltetrahydrofolate cyclo-ligase [Clostridium sp. LBM24168]